MAFLIKVLVIFIGSGLVTLFAFWLAKEISTIPQLILNFIGREKLKLAKEIKMSSKSGVYEILSPVGQKFKLFSSHKGMKLIN